MEETWTERTTLFDTTFDCKVVADIIITTTHNAKLIRVNGAKSINQVLIRLLGFEYILKLVQMHFIKGFIQIKTDCPKLQVELVCTFEKKCEC